MKFDDAGIHPIVRENISLCGYEFPTPIQAYAIPAVLTSHDLIAIAQTGLRPSKIHICCLANPTRLGQNGCIFDPSSFSVDGKGEKAGSTTP